MSKLNLVLCGSELHTASSKSSCHCTKTCFHPLTLSHCICLKWSVCFQLVILLFYLNVGKKY